MLPSLAEFEIWFVTGSQHLYGDTTLTKVNTHSKEIARYLDEQPSIPVKIIFKPVLTTPEEIFALIKEANYQDSCIGSVSYTHLTLPTSDLV